MSAALEAGNQALAEGGEQYVISGERNLLAVQDLSQDMARLRSCSSCSSARPRWCRSSTCRCAARACRSSSAANPASRAPDDVSVVTSPYKVDGEVVGTVGVIGPTRMAYERVVPIVDVTAKLLSSALSQALTRGVLLVNLGTPAAPTPQAVRGYLAEFLSDPRVVELPRWLWLPILHGIVLRTRPAKSARRIRSDLDAGRLAARRAHRAPGAAAAGDSCGHPGRVRDALWRAVASRPRCKELPGSAGAAALSAVLGQHHRERRATCCRPARRWSRASTIIRPTSARSRRTCGATGRRTAAARCW